MEGGSSTTGEQTNCDLTRYVKLKKEANHVGPTLEARLYTLEYFWCVPSTRRTRRSLLSTPSPTPTGAVARRMRWSLLTTPYARSLAHARGGSRHEEKILLLPPFTPHPYYLGYRDYIILFGIYMSFSTPSIYLYKATIKKYILHLYKATNSNRDKSYYSLLSSLWLNFKISPTKVDGEWSN